MTRRRTEKLFRFRSRLRPAFEGLIRSVSLVAELSGRRIVAFEIKAGSTPGRSDARHLDWLARELGEDFVQGVVFHTGPRLYELGDRIVAAPISTLWA